jgi:hypothetical protein
MTPIRTLTSIAATTGLGALLATGLGGCSGGSDAAAQEQAKPKGAFVVIEETAKGKYKIKEEFPSDETRIVLKQLDGKERVLTQAEMDDLIKKEAARIDNGTSNLTNPNAQMHSGMGLGEVLLASAAGSIMGAWIGSKLFGSPAYQNHRKAGYKSPSTYSRSKSSFNKPRKRASTKRGGFFGSKTRRSSSRRRSGGFFGG